MMSLNIKDKQKVKSKNIYYKKISINHYKYRKKLILLSILEKIMEEFF
jgi:hypothetical protein